MLYNLSPSHSITHAFKTFGVADDSTNVVACVFNANKEMLNKLDTVIKGEKVENPQSVLDAMDSDKLERLTKLYKLRPGDFVHRSLPDAVDNILSVRNFKSR